MKSFVKWFMFGLLAGGTAFLCKYAYGLGRKKALEEMAPYEEYYQNHLKSGYGKVTRDDIRPNKQEV